MPKLLVQDVDRTFLVDVRPDESVTIGRARDCDVPLETQLASRKHLTLVAGETGEHRARDEDSTNGSYLNGVRMEHAMPLEDGDVLRVGECRIVYRAVP